MRLAFDLSYAHMEGVGDCRVLHEPHLSRRDIFEEIAKIAERG